METTKTKVTFYESIDGKQTTNVCDTYIELDKQIKELEKQKEAIKNQVKAELETGEYNNGTNTMKLISSTSSEWDFDTIFRLFDGNLIPKIMKPSTTQVNKFAELLSDEKKVELENSAVKKITSRILIK